MTANVSKRQLLHWDKELQSLQGSILEVFLQSKIKEFLNTNGFRVQSIHKGRIEIVKKYYEFEGDNLKMIEEKPVLLEGKTEEDAEKEMNEYLDGITMVTL